MSEPWRIMGVPPIVARRRPGRSALDRILDGLCRLGWHAGPVYESLAERWCWCARCDRKWVSLKARSGN